MVTGRPPFTIRFVRPFAVCLQFVAEERCSLARLTDAALLLRDRELQAIGQERLDLRHHAAGLVLAADHADEQDRPDVAKARRRWRSAQPFMDPDRFVFPGRDRRDHQDGPTHRLGPEGRAAGRCCAQRSLDDHHVHRRSARQRDRRAAGAAMRNEGRHRDYTEQFLAPALSPGDVVVMDNLPAHKVAGVREAIEAVGASVMYPAALQPRPQPNRDGLRQAEGAPAQSLRPNTRRVMGHHRCRSRSLRPKRMPTLHRPLWLCVRVKFANPKNTATSCRRSPRMFGPFLRGP